MKLREYMLNEEKLKKSDRNIIKGLIEEPKKTSFTLQSFSSNYEDDEREVNVRKTVKGGVEFSYNYDFDELTAKIVDLCDELGKTFKTEIDKHINTIYFKVRGEKKQ